MYIWEAGFIQYLLLILGKFEVYCGSSWCFKQRWRSGHSILSVGYVYDGCSGNQILIVLFAQEFIPAKLNLYLDMLIIYGVKSG